MLMYIRAMTISVCTVRRAVLTKLHLNDLEKQRTSEMPNVVILFFSIPNCRTTKMALSSPRSKITEPFRIIILERGLLYACA